MSESASVQAAVQLENRLTTIEATLTRLVDVNTEMRDHVKAQNGRIGTLESSQRDLKEDIRVQRELVETPRWGRFEAVSSQVKSLWEARTRQEMDEAHDAAADDEQQRWWQRIKVRFETVLAVLGIAGGVYALGATFIGG